MNVNPAALIGSIFPYNIYKTNLHFLKMQLVMSKRERKKEASYEEGPWLHTFCLAACSATMSLKSSFSTWACCSLTCSSYFCVMAMGSSSSSSGARATSTPCDSCPPPALRPAVAWRESQEAWSQRKNKSHQFHLDFYIGSHINLSRLTPDMS